MKMVKNASDETKEATREATANESRPETAATETSTRTTATPPTPISASEARQTLLSTPDVQTVDGRTPQSASPSSSLVPPSRPRRRFLRTIANRLRIAAHLSRARRAQDVTHPDVLGDHLIDMMPVYARQLSQLSVSKQAAATPAVLASQTEQQQRRMSLIPPHAGLGQTASNATAQRYFLAGGNIHFWRNDHYSDGHPYMKVTHDVHIEEVAHLMRREWQMPSPRIVTLIISNVASLREWTNARQMINFQKGLMKAANSTSMWIITNGIDIGIGRLIGDAIRKEMREMQSFRSQAAKDFGLTPKLNVIGIMREDHLRYGENLGADGSDRAELVCDGNNPEEYKFELNPDHTHYVVVRDSTISKTGINLFVLRLLQYLSAIAGTKFAQDSPDSNNIRAPYARDTYDTESLGAVEIPVVSVVIQGGYDSARLVLDHLKRRMPVVVLRGSGGLADLLAFAYTEMKHRCRDMSSAWDAEFVESYLKPELSNKIVNHFPRMRESTLGRNIFRDRILESVRFSKQNGLSYLKILNMHSSSCKLENLSEYLLQALFKSRHSDRQRSELTFQRIMKDLYLTLDWNCPHVAKTEVLMKDPSCVLKLEKPMFEEALLRPNREDFIDLFLTHGFRVHKFLSPIRLRRLYKQVHNQEFFHTVCWEGILGHSLIAKQSKYFIDTDLNWLIETCTGLDNFIDKENLSENVIGMYRADPAAAERKALVILAMWAVFSNRQQLAKTLWKHSDQPIHLALILSMILERLSWYSHETSTKHDLLDESKKFADYAVGVLDACFAEDVGRANDVLSEKSPEWNYKTAVDIAANARTRAFLAHPCCQKWLTNTFLGDIRIRDVTWGFMTFPVWLKILLCAFFFLPMYIWVRFTPEAKLLSELDKEKEKEREREKDEEDDKYHDERDTAEDDSGNLLDHRGGGSDGSNQVNGGKKGGRKKSDDAEKGYYYATLLRDREVFIRSQPPLWKMIYRMWTAPITKFWTFQVFYILYLTLFSVVVLWPKCGNWWLDVSACSWTALIVVEYIRRTYILYRKYTSVPLVFKCVEIICIIAFVIIYAFGRVFYIQLYSAYTNKVILCIALIYFYYRLIAIYLPISPTLGPLLYRLRLMVTVDFVNFMRMALVVILSGGITMQAVLYPDLDISWEMLRQTFHRGWFTLFLTPAGELEKDEACDDKLLPEGFNDTCWIGRYNDTSCRNVGFFPYLFSIQYFVFLKLILLTLLYALFAATASKIQTETDNIWKFQRYVLVVDFEHRLALPAPLSIFCYIYYILKYVYRLLTCYWCRKSNCCKRINCRGKDQIDGKGLHYGKPNERIVAIMSEEDYNFWKHLAKEYSEEQAKKAEEENLAKKQWDATQTICDEIEYEKKVLRQLKGKVSELERMLNLSQVYLENIMHLSSKSREEGVLATTAQIHFLSRHSPYPGTRVQRTPVPDKYVPWEVMWIDYDPVAYTKPKIEFPTNAQQFVDEDILLLRELQLDEVKSKLPVYQWNCKSTNAAGITIDRQCWTVNEDGSNLVYVLDNGIPRNPFGRTGQRGRGALSRWGPNHYVILIITRWQTSRGPVSGSRPLEFVVEKTDKRDQLNLPGRFIPGDCLYLDLQTLFKTTDMPNWTSSDEMIQFFKSCVAAPSGEPTSPPITADGSATPTETGLIPPQGLKYERVACGYMDDPLNTDHAWKEVELWHFHFTQPDCLSEKMQLTQLSWRVFTEDVFVKLPLGQATLLQDVTHKLQPAIL